MGADRGDGPVEHADRRGDERLFRQIARIRHQITRGEIVGAVGDQIVARNDVERVRSPEPDRMGLDRDVRIEPRDRGRGAFDLGRADVRRRVDDLALQVRQRHRVVVDDPERADAGSREIKQHRRAEPARADHQHARASERGLSGSTHLAQHDMAGIAFEFVGRQHATNPYMFRPSRAQAAARSSRVDPAFFAPACAGGPVR